MPTASVTGGDSGGVEQEGGGAPDPTGGAEPTAGDDDELDRALEEECALSADESVEDQVRRQFSTPEELAARLNVPMQVEDAAAPGPAPVAEPYALTLTQP